MKLNEGDKIVAKNYFYREKYNISGEAQEDWVKPGDVFEACLSSANDKIWSLRSVPYVIGFFYREWMDKLLFSDSEIGQLYFFWNRIGGVTLSRFDRPAFVKGFIVKFRDVNGDLYDYYCPYPEIPEILKQEDEKENSNS